MIQKSKDTSMVSVVVITYNSSRYVLETLESIYNQTYDNLELIISDDCSTDDTLSKCRQWVQHYGHRFRNCKVLFSTQNQGIPGNCNKAVKETSGEWFKLLAGDDALETSAIENFIDFTISDPKIKFCFSDFSEYKDEFTQACLVPDNVKHYGRSKVFSKLSAKRQWQALLYHAIIHGPTTFIHTDTFWKVGGYDETFPFLEDRPFYLKWTSLGYHIDFMQVKTVKYRVHSHSITNKGKNQGVPDFTLKFGQLVLRLIYPHYTIAEKILFKAKFGYWKYYNRRECLKYHHRVLRRLWYLLVELSEMQQYSKLDKVLKNYDTR